MPKAYRAVAVLALLTGCSPESPAPPSPDPTILYSYGLVGMSGGNRDLVADIGMTVHAYSYVRRPTTLTITSAALYPPADPRTPLAALSLTVVDRQLDFAGVDDEYVSLVNDGTLNRTLAPACGAVRVVLVLHSSSCDCDVRVEGNAAVTCYADNGADPELAAVGEPAPAGKPCGARFFSTHAGVEELDIEHDLSLRHRGAAALLGRARRDAHVPGARVLHVRERRAPARAREHQPDRARGDVAHDLRLHERRPLDDRARRRRRASARRRA